MSRNKLINRLLVILLAFAVIPLSGQTKVDNLLPLDPQVRTGRLKNGLNYYIQYNQKPEKRVELRLAVNVGSVLEDKDQLGLAHFVEHMAFNGTRNFEKNELIRYLQSLGIKFGPDINAYTSFNETVYMLTLPSDSVHIINTGFQVMEDWAHQVTLSDEEIDKERGVIMEEWRVGRGAMQRMRDKNLPVILSGSRYAERLPIGTPEVIEHAPCETIRRFYNDWYRPELMAFIVIGDIDVDAMERKVKEHFGRIKPTKGARERQEYGIPTHNQTLVSVATDAEAPVTFVNVYHKLVSSPVQTYNDYRNSLKNTLFISMLNHRLSELRDQADPPFINAYGYYGRFIARDASAFVLGALVSDTALTRGLKAVLTECRRIADHGFAPTELERHKQILLNNMERAYNERDKTESSLFASGYIRHYLYNEASPGIAYEYEQTKNWLPEIGLDEINKLATTLITSHDRVIAVNGPDKEGVTIPGEEELLALVLATDKLLPEPYTDHLPEDKLLALLPKPGKIIKKNYLESPAVTEITLSNGARVILKPTDFKNDEILLRAESFGGLSAGDEKDDMSARYASQIIAESGIAGFSRTDLQKMMAGKTVTVSPYIGTYTHGISGSTTPRDIEDFLQLVHLYFTSPRFDSALFTSYIARQKALFRNMLSEPMQYFYYRYNQLRCNDHPRGPRMPDEADWDRIEHEKVMQIYKELFANLSEFTFVLTGAFLTDSIIPLLETYIGSLPSTDQKATWVDMGIRPPVFPIEEQVFKGSEPKSMVILYFEKERPYNQRDAFLINLIAGILDRKYIEVLREEMSGVYSVRVSPDMGEIPYSRTSLQITIPCSPTNADSLTMAALVELKRIVNEGITPEELATAKATSLRTMEVNLKTNRYWLSLLTEAFTMDRSFTQVTDYKEYVQSVTIEDIGKVARESFNPESYLRIILYPEAMKN